MWASSKAEKLLVVAWVSLLNSAMAQDALDRWELHRVQQLDSLLLDEELASIFCVSFWRIFELFEVRLF